MYLLVRFVLWTLAILRPKPALALAQFYLGLLDRAVPKLRKVALQPFLPFVIMACVVLVLLALFIVPESELQVGSRVPFFFRTGIGRGV